VQVFGAVLIIPIHYLQLLDVHPKQLALPASLQGGIDQPGLLRGCRQTQFLVLVYVGGLCDVATLPQGLIHTNRKLVDGFRRKDVFLPPRLEESEHLVEVLLLHRSPEVTLRLDPQSPLERRGELHLQAFHVITAGAKPRQTRNAIKHVQPHFRVRRLDVLHQRPDHLLVVQLGVLVGEWDERSL